ncbi:MAG: sugar phosphate isomerase/epimerase family protein [Gaiella sp.]
MTRLALSEISTVGATFAEDVAAYAAAGFDGIGIWEMKLPPDDEANLALLHEHGLAVANCIPAVPSFFPLGIPGMEGPDDLEERIASLCASVERLARYQPESVVCLSGPLGGRHEADARAHLRDGLARVAAVARAVDAPLAFEPVHASQRDVVSFVNSIEDAIAILSEAGLDDVGLMLDLYHVWDDPAVWDTIARATYRIAGVHVSDWPAESGRTDRALPGAGRSQTRELLEALELSGFAGSFDVEVFAEPDGFWGLPVGEAARRAHAAISAVT